MSYSAGFEVVEVATANEIEEARRLFREYAGEIGFGPCFQSFDAELASLPGDYRRPRGRLLLARRGSGLACEAVGCVALRPLDESTCEIKRLYIPPENRGAGLGRLLVERLIMDARQTGYTHVRLETLPVMTAALRLYETLGFRDIPPYCANPIPEARYLGLTLA